MKDYELIKRIRQGDRALFGELADRYYNDVFRYCYYQTGDEQAAWDCTQETFYRLIRFLDSYTERGKFKAYLLRIALNACRDYLRRSYRSELSYEDFSDGLYDTGRSSHTADFPLLGTSCGKPDRNYSLLNSSPENQVETNILIQNALNRLPALQREAIILFYYYGYKQREIANITGVPLSTVKTRLRTGTEKLQEFFRNEELL